MKNLEKILPAMSILVLTALVAPGSLILIISAIFLMPFFAIIHIAPLGIGLVFYLKRIYRALYATTIIFAIVVALLLITDQYRHHDAWDTYIEGGWTSLIDELNGVIVSSDE